MHVDLTYGKKPGSLQCVILMCQLCSKYILSGHCRLKKKIVQVERGYEMDRWKVCVQPQPGAKWTLERLLRMQGRMENISVSFDIGKVVGLRDSRHTSTSDCWSRKIRLVVFTEFRVFSFKMKKGMTKHPGSLGERNLFSVKKHTSQSCKVSQDWKFPMAEIKTSARSKCKYRKRGGISESLSYQDTWQTQKGKTSLVVIAKI